MRRDAATATRPTALLRPSPPPPPPPPSAETARKNFLAGIHETGNGQLLFARISRDSLNSGYLVRFIETDELTDVYADTTKNCYVERSLASNSIEKVSIIFSSS